MKCFKADVLLVPLQIPSGNLGMFGNSGAAQARTMQQPQQPPVQPLNSSQPSLRAQVPQFLSPQVRWSYPSYVLPFPRILPCAFSSACLFCDDPEALQALSMLHGEMFFLCTLCYLCMQILLLLFAKGSVPRKLRTSFSFFLLLSVNTREHCY